MIKAVMFDRDGVLLDSMDANCKFFQDLIESSGYRRPSKEEVTKVFHMTMLQSIAYLTKEKSDKKVKEIWETGHSFPYPTELLKIPSDSKHVIKELKKKYKIGIVTSSIRRGIGRLCRVYGIEENFFDVIVTFEDIKKPKPDPESLLLAANRLGISPKEAVYVGDQESDRIAAKRAGMGFIFYSVGSGDSFKEIKTQIENLDKN